MFGFMSPFSRRYLPLPVKYWSWIQNPGNTHTRWSVATAVYASTYKLRRCRDSHHKAYLCCVTLVWTEDVTPCPGSFYPGPDNPDHASFSLCQLSPGPDVSQPHTNPP